MRRSPGRRAPSSAAVLLALATAACAGPVEPRLRVSTAATLIDDLVDIRVEGLGAHQAFVVEATTWDHRDRRWMASARLRADARGAARLADQAPLEGTYRRTDPMGLFWSAEHVPGAGEEAPEHPGIALLPGHGYRTELRLLVADEMVDRAILVRTLTAEGVARRDVRTVGVVGTLFTPGTRELGAAAVVVAGSDGGIASAEWRAALLASRGFHALALTYFRFESLPASLLEIPLETVGRAADWLRAEVGVERVGLIGFSKGSELSLSASARFPSFGAVVAYAPSSVVWQGIGPGFPRLSSWTHEGAPLAFVPYTLSADVQRQLAAPGPKRYRRLYRESLDADAAREAVAAARIPVEAIDAPLLLITGTEDGSWPSDRMAREILRSRGAAGRGGDLHLSYEGAGHLIFAGSLPTAGNVVTAAQDFGGGKAANAHAQADSWPRVLAFLERHLVP